MQQCVKMAILAGHRKISSQSLKAVWVAKIGKMRLEWHYEEVILLVSNHISYYY